MNNAAQIEAVYLAFGATVNGKAPKADYSFDRAARLAASFYALADMSAPETFASASDTATVRPAKA